MQAWAIDRGPFTGLGLRQQPMCRPGAAVTGYERAWGSCSRPCAGLEQQQRAMCGSGAAAQGHVRVWGSSKGSCAGLGQQQRVLFLLASDGVGLPTIGMQARGWA